MLMQPPIFTGARNAFDPALVIIPTPSVPDNIAFMDGERFQFMDSEQIAYED